MASGKLTFDKGVGKGRYDDLHHAIELMLEPLGDKPPAAMAGSDQPCFTVYIGNRNGHLSVAGAAWVKKIGTGPNSGQLFYSLQIDDPSFAQTLNLSAFPSTDATGKAIAGEFDIVWRRARQQAA